MIDAQIKGIGGLLGCICGLTAPIHGLIICIIVFILTDFVTGIWAYWKRRPHRLVRFHFKCERAWDTIIKLVFTMGGICLAWMLDNYVLVDVVVLNLAKLFTGLACGFEFLSILRNMSYISNHPIFRFFGKYMSNKMSEAGIPVKEIDKESGKK